MKQATLILVILTVMLGAAAQQDVRQITFGAKQDRDPVVSPDGNHLVFSSDRTGNYDLYIHTFGEAGVLQLTRSPKDDRDANWSPDSKTLIFSSKRTGKGDLYKTARDGEGGYLQLSDRDDIEEFPSFAPRGDAVLFVRQPGKLLRRQSDKEVVLASGAGSISSARSLGEGYSARFSPDGKKVVFVSRRTKNADIWLMNADGGMQTQLTTSDKNDEDPFFSPDGKHIVFSSDRTGNNDLWVMDADGGNQRQLTADPANEIQPCWSSGGYLYYVKELSPGNSNIFRIKAP